MIAYVENRGDEYYVFAKPNEHGEHYQLVHVDARFTMAQHYMEQCVDEQFRKSLLRETKGWDFKKKQYAKSPKVKRFNTTLDEFTL